MANERGHYGNNSVGVSVGQAPRTIYVEREHHASIGKWLLGAVVVGGGVLFARHQSRQIETLYKTGGVPLQTFTGSLRETARELPTRARQAYRGLTAHVRSAPKLAAALPESPAGQAAPAHSVRARSSKR